MNGMINAPEQYSLTNLRRWSCGDHDQLPSKDTIKAIHVYDFDNTLFSSPLPNKQLWAGPSIGQLQTQEVFIGGGWWHDSSILASTGEGVDKEEPRGWAGHWNEQIVQLVELSMAQRDALTVLLTGRSESEFTALVRRILDSRKLNFDLIVLKPTAGPSGETFTSTMAFKQAFLSAVMHTYPNATTLRIYEDRVKHTKAFRDFFEDFNTRLLGIPQNPNPEHPSRSPITADVIQVTEEIACLDPTTEVAAVQRMINIHNSAIKAGTARPHTRPLRLHRNVFFTAYLIPQNESKRLQQLVQYPAGMPSTARDDVHKLANSILIAPKPADAHTLLRVGGVGHTVQWRVTGLAVFENRIWAARVQPVNQQEKVFTHTRPAHVVLALRRGSRPADADRIHNWQPLNGDSPLVFKATVGEKVQLRIEDDVRPQGRGRASGARQHRGAGTAGGLDASPPSKRLNMREQDFIPVGGGYEKNNNNIHEDENRRPAQTAFSANQGARQGQGPHRRAGGASRPQGRSGAGYSKRDGQGGGGRGGRGRGGPQGGYRSLDDVNGRQVRGYADYDGGQQGAADRPMDY